jgi:hypothetical protein
MQGYRAAAAVAGVLDAPADDAEFFVGRHPC